MNISNAGKHRQGADYCIGGTTIKLRCSLFSYS